ncbi:MAG: PadR family transcriptional regulator [Candidatus Parvarchaeota archaeon]|nr:PadR family transcriptional regulator [Candidatus Jingweiarchaeum tengchongense]MCW1298262.1 PadR family transcriptional regulator [Candidatus Jingweiarchaeum tengchongense]MCW1300353.1 PadR family transcriptional regulator [Candidatus Jingweiarchaeum tengchongense]MCW1304802.1 PadR family transcriptional regulator [Candidatus Jingweiarchaeum tengchongense]MCW1305392.1 PadR family transcriptional regulator [Candidatus Jingweiarchaeum tengchongense]
MVREPIERLKEKVLKENLWIFIFKLLSEKDAYAYELRKKIEKKFGFLAGNVTSYKVLYLLEIDGYVKSYSNGRRIYYKLTKKGKKELNKAKNFFKDIYNFLV